MSFDLTAVRMQSVSIPNVAYQTYPHTLFPLSSFGNLSPDYLWEQVLLLT